MQRRSGLIALVVATVVGVLASGCLGSASPSGSNPYHWGQGFKSPSPAADLGAGGAMQPAPTPLRRAERALRHAQFGPWRPASDGPLLHNVSCAMSTKTRVWCHAAYQDRYRAIVFGVKPGGGLYVIVSGPLAIA